MASDDAASRHAQHPGDQRQHGVVGIAGGLERTGDHEQAHEQNQDRPVDQLE